MAELITLGLISAQDVSFGYSTFSATLLDQTTQTVNSVNLSYLYSPYTVTFSATPTFDLQNGTVQSITLTGNVTSSTFQNDSATVPTGAVLVLRITQDIIGGRTFAWPSNVTGRTAVTVGAAVSATTIATLIYNGTNWEFTGVPIVVSTLGLTTGTVTGTGTASYLPKFSSATVIANSSAYDSGNGQIFIGNTSTDAALSTNPYCVTIGNNGGFLALGATTNASALSLTIVNGSYAAIAANRTGAGTYLPLAFFTNAAEVGRWTTDAQLLVGGTSTDIGSVVSRIVTLTNLGGVIVAGATTNASYGALGIINGSYVQVKSSSSGVGTTLPLQFSIDATEVGRFRTDGQFLVGGTSTDIGSVVPRIVAVQNNGGVIVAGATTNASYGAFGIINGSYVQIASAHSAAGTTLPIQFSIDSTEIARFKTDGSFYVGLASSDRGAGPYVISKVPYIVATATSNAEYVEIGNIAGSYSYISTSHTGAGTSRPLVFGVDAVEKMRLTTTGQMFFGGTSTDMSLSTTPFYVTFGTTSGFLAATATTNASVLSLSVVTATYVAIASNRSGAGTYLPMAFFTNGGEVGRWVTAGQLLVGGTSTDIAGLGAATVLTMATGGGFICATATTNASYGSVGINSGGTFVIESAHSGVGATLPIGFQMGTTEFVRIAADGGVTVNTAGGALPTGGSKGAGTINVATNIYLNNTAYTSPDAVLELWATGQIVQHKREWTDKYEIYPLAEVQRFAKTNFYLPQLEFFSAHSQPAGIKERFDTSLLLHEETFVHLFSHEDRLTEVERRLVNLENRGGL